MFARVIQFEINMENTEPEAALEQFKALVLPDLRVQSGYVGLFVLRTQEGKGLLMSLWESEEAAEAGVASGYYDQQVAKLVTLVREPPGRQHYEVMYSELPQKLET